jgi:hypothetical protein
MSFQRAWTQPDLQRTAERQTPIDPNFSLSLVNGVSPLMTATDDNTVIAAQGAGNCIYVTDILVTNGHASVGTYVVIKNDTTIIYKGYAAAGGGGFVISFRTPIRLTANKALKAANLTDASETVVSASGYLGF